MALIWSNISSLKVNYVSQLRVPRRVHFVSRTDKHVIKLHFNASVVKRVFLLKKIKDKSINVSISGNQLSGTTDILDFIEDDYGGVIINPDSLPDASNAFAAVLQSSLSHWKCEGKKGVWLRILEKQADLVPVALKSGFCYHHAEPGYVMLTYWIPDGPCLLPSTGTHQIGVGAFVINQAKEAEDIFSGAIREVKEETGVETSFLEVVAFRHAHQVIFEKSDILFICLLKPHTCDITVDTTEIEDAMWMPLEEFLNQQVHREDELLRKIINICVNMCENNCQGFKVEQLMSRFDDRISHLYYLDL